MSVISPELALRSELRAAHAELTVRGLASAAKFISELLYNSESTGDEDECDELTDYSQENVYADIPSTKELHKVMFGSSLISSGEYQRCAYLLKSKTTGDVKSNLGNFLAAYALYMAGEKIKDQTANEDQTGGKTRNPFLGDLYIDLYPRHSAGTMDGHLLYIFAVVVRDLKQQGYSVQALGGSTDISSLSVRELFMQSLAKFPWNW